MNQHVDRSDLTLLAKFLRAYLRTNLRGRTRLTFLLANKLASLRTVPVRVEDRSPVYVDLRFGMSHEWLRGSPWTTAPFEPDEQAIMRKVVQRGETVFDIGANMGVHTALLSQLVGPNGRVIAFEPNPELITPLAKTVAGLGNASLQSFALSDHAGESTLYVPSDHSMGSLADYTSDPSLADWRAEIRLSKAQTVTCELKSIDSLVEAKTIPRPDFIKCDVEGAELMVFKGGEQTLNRLDAPIILFEAIVVCSRGFGLPKSAAMDFLSGLPLANYRFFEVREGGTLTPLSFENFTAPNILAVPESKLARVRNSA